MPSTGAAAWRRAAVLTTSPATIPSPSEGRASRATTASPVLTAMRTCRSSEGSPSFSSRMASRTASAARTARSGSSSCATGAPKAAITASPMNFSTVPPKRSISDRRRAKYGESMARTSSGSSCSARPVKPTRSAKKTLTIFRSSRAIACSAASGAVQALQSVRLLGRLKKHRQDDDAAAGDRGGGRLLRDGDPDPERPEDDLEQRDQSHLGGGQEPRAHGHEGEAEAHLADAEEDEEQKVTPCSRPGM